MILTSTIFLFLFLPITLAGYYLIRSELRNIFLLLASIVFYAFGEPKLVILLMTSTFINYIGGLFINKTKAKVGIHRFLFILMLLYNFGLLYYFKYLIFTVKTINSIAGTGFALPSIALPLGISFFTFRCVSYIIDVYWDSVPVQKNYINVALYISFFPQISMGPITRYTEFESQLHGRKFDFEFFSEGTKRLIAGLGKKLILANNLGLMVDKIFSMQAGERTVLLAWMGILGYLLQLYFDFSGYSDMAIGIGKMFGFNTPENFNYPYISKSIAEFWNRWHVTLGTWLKNYLYTPIFRGLLNSNERRNKKIPLFICDVIALLVTWVCIGFWHGAAWIFLFYGLYNFLFILIERSIEYFEKKKRKQLKLKKKPDSMKKKILSHIYFFVVIIFGQLIFRSGSMSFFIQYVKDMFGMNGNVLYNSTTYYYIIHNIVVFICSLIFCFPFFERLKNYIKTKPCVKEINNIFITIFYIFVLITSISFVFTDTYQSFIYFQF